MTSRQSQARLRAFSRTEVRPSTMRKIALPFPGFPDRIRKLAGRAIRSTACPRQQPCWPFPPDHVRGDRTALPTGLHAFRIEETRKGSPS